MSDALYTYWVGMDIPVDTSAADVAAFNDFYSNVHKPEVLAGNPGFLRGRRYELAQDDTRGARGPRFIAAYDIESKETAQLYISRNDGPASGRPVYSDGPAAWQQRNTKWRLMWQHVLNNPAAAKVSASPYMYLVGMNEAAGSGEAELAQFNEFYNTIHVPEVLAGYDFVTGARYKNMRTFLHPEPGAPNFLAMYGIKDEAAAKSFMKDRLAAVPGASPFSDGPPPWQNRDTKWRLTYRLVG
ncbi:MAG: hypothetical protein CK528_04765 [Alcaligenaceae bacterium]|nr:MAG: hypothetical protein CK528_04765 [Alcaligenaceae bacterium]